MASRLCPPSPFHITTPRFGMSPVEDRRVPTIVKMLRPCTQVFLTLVPAVPDVLSVMSGSTTGVHLVAESAALQCGCGAVEGEQLIV